MRGGEQKQGYTIVEVMIFLAVSGVMFLIAASFINGKQTNTEFRQSMNNINSQIQQVINDVGNGFYPSNNGFPCQALPTAGSAPAFTGTIAEQGGNQGCVFLGKVVQFSADSNPSNYNVFSIAGRQSVSNVNSPAPNTFAQAQPRAITSPSDLTVHATLDWGLQVTSMYSGSPLNHIGAVGFFGSFNQTEQGGSQTVTAVAIPNSDLNQTTSHMADTVIAGSTEPAALDTELLNHPNPNVTICFQDGASNFGSLNIGGSNGQRLSTSIQLGKSATEVGC